MKKENSDNIVSSTLSICHLLSTIAATVSVLTLSPSQAKRDAITDTLSQLLEGDNTAIVASPVVAGDVANDLSLTDTLNDLNRTP